MVVAGPSRPTARRRFNSHFEGIVASFTDAHGKQWDVALSIGHAVTIKDRLGICLVDLTEEDRAAKRAEHDVRKLVGDPVEFINVMYLLCEEQATACGIDDVGFGRRLDPDSLYDAMAALVEAITVFILPRTMKSRGADKVKTSAAKLRQAMAHKAAAIMDAADVEIDTTVSEFCKSHTSSPASSV